MRLIGMLLLLSWGCSYGVILNHIKVTGNTFTKTETIRFFLPELKEGKTYEENELQRIVNRIEERLQRTGWFFKVSAYVTGTSKGENYRNVVIEVEEGYLYRWYGGKIYGGFGMDNLFGNGWAYRIELGYNRQLAKITVLFPSLRLVVQGYVGNRNQTMFLTNKSFDLQSLGGEINALFYFWRDWAIYGGGEYSWNTDDSYQYLFENYYPRVGVLADTRDNDFSPSKGYVFNINQTLLLFRYPRFTMEGQVFKELYHHLKLASRFILITEDKTVPLFFLLNSKGINGVRTMFQNNEGYSLVMMNVELRWNFWETTFLSVGTLFESVLFADVGVTGIEQNSFKDMNNYTLAFGIGLRTFLANPVFVPMRFEVGFDTKLRPSFYFDVNYPW